MIKTNSAAIDRKPTELYVEEFDRGKFYRGTEAAFIASGLIKPDWFPGRPGNPKSSCHIGILDGEMKVLPYKSVKSRLRKELTSIRLWKVGKRFAAYIDFPKEEVTRREEEEERQRLRKKVEEMHAEKKRELDAAPKSPHEFLDERKERIEYELEGVLNLFRRAVCGYHYSSKAVEEAQDLISRLNFLAEHSQAFFDKGRHQNFMGDVDRKAIKAHPEFSAFMATTLAIGKAALHD